MRILLGAPLVLAAIAAVIWWGSIRETLMDPGTAYQTFQPPPQPNYADKAAWALWPDDEEAGAADVFFVHPTTYQGRQWNGPADDFRADQLLREVMLPNYAGPFDEIGRVWAPYYRQASLYTQMTLREDARDARAFAYGDVKRALDMFLALNAAQGEGRPVVIVGVEQGAGLVARAVSEALAEQPEAAGRIAAVYLLEKPLPVADAPLPLCEARDQAGCVVSYFAVTQDEAHLTAERRRHAGRWRGSSIVALRDEPLACVNPLSGAANETMAPADANIGAASATGLPWGEAPGFLARQVSAQCVDGLLEVSRPVSPSLRGRNGWADSQRVRSYNWFYADLSEDVKARVAAIGSGQ